MDEHTARMKVGEALLAAMQKEYPEGDALLDVRHAFPVVYVIAHGHDHHIRIIPERGRERASSGGETP